MNDRQESSPISHSRPLVSTVIAVRNGERFLSSAIESVLDQSYPAAEILVVDGHSTDRTGDIARSFAEVRYIPQVGRGVADAWNVGIEAARGEFLAFLSHDDLWTPDKLQIQVGYLSAHPEIEYTIAHVKFELEPGCDVPSGFRRGLLLGDHVGEIMETLVVRRALFDRIGRFDSTLYTAEDADWYARAHDAHVAFAIIPRVLLIKRVHDDNTSLNNPLNDRNLLTALKRSIDRKHNQEESGHGHA